MNIAVLPAQLFCLFHGNFTDPNFLPIKSAAPSPPLISATAVIPIGLPLQYTRMAVRSMRT